MKAYKKGTEIYLAGSSDMACQGHVSFYRSALTVLNKPIQVRLWLRQR